MISAALLLFALSSTRETAESPLARAHAKAPEDWRSPKPGGTFTAPSTVAKRLGLR